MAPLGRSIEMATLKLREDSVAHGSSYTMREPIYDDVPPDSVTTRFINSFRRDPSRRVTPLDPKIEAAARAEEANHLGIRYYDIRQATLQTAHSGLARKLKGRHLQMIAIGGSIGTFFLPCGVFSTPSYPLQSPTLFVGDHHSFDVLASPGDCCTDIC